MKWGHVMDIGMITKLTDVLEQENTIYQEILKISEDKTNIIIEGKVSQLENIIKLEQALIIRLGKLEELREDLVSEIAISVDTPVEELKISDIINFAGKEKGEKLEICQGIIKKSIDDLTNVNDLNSKLLKNSLEFIDFSINILSRPDAGANNYGNTGQVSSSGKRNFLDMRL